MSTAGRATFNPARGADRGGNIAIPTATKRALDVPSQNSLLLRETSSSAPSKEELKRKLEQTDRVAQKARTEEPEPLGITFPEPEAVEETEQRSDNEQESEYESESEDEEELMRELARIKQERAEAEAKRLAEEAAKQAAIKQQQAETGNPLLGGAAALRRRWDDDTVFRNQSSKAEPKRQFVNDVVRSDAHKKFLNKYIG
jgi:protein CWC15